MRRHKLGLFVLITLGLLLVHQAAVSQQTQQRSRTVQVQKNEAPAPRPSFSRKSPAPAKSVDRPGPAATTEPARITGIRFVSSKNYTRVTMDLSHRVRYETNRLKDDAEQGLPPRVYIDVHGAQLALSSKEPLPVQDGLLKQVRAGQFSPGVVRVVLDMASVADYNTFLLSDPHRLVIDIQGQNHGLQDRTVAAGRDRAGQGTNKQKRLAPTGIRKVVLDPGHGGKDPGAIGLGGVMEKDIVLSVAQRLAVRLRKEMGIEVVLTRTDDTYVSLEDRTAIANAEEADIFISLHMNASPNPASRGLETYYLDNTNDEAAIRLAARENGMSRQQISDLQFILSDLTQNMKLEDSISLAHRLHGSLVDGMSHKMSDVKDLGVKKALFYVLVGARMPSVLVELFFITNQIEAKAMSQARYQDAVVNALFDGIQKYSQNTLALKTF